ncbi:MAG TPA: 4a-hydroxytetrahydrobiopterin dehydratase [Gemmatimonadaceae bacterium]|jgi:4a-hydroxytetrahydrobiopterin dehydratase|nr:4a-hydroxytetrahydrobiopterin dehydratase [Gemmatimonadaceae bacterium]
MAELLSDIAVQRELGGLQGWSRRGDALVRTYQFRNFSQAMEFVNRVAGLAESAGHHPDIDIRYSKVTLSLSTHDAGGITANDVSLAKSIDAENSGGAGEISPA